MSIRLRLATYGVGLLAAFGGAYALGVAVGPLDDRGTTGRGVEQQTPESPTPPMGSHERHGAEE